MRQRAIGLLIVLSLCLAVGQAPAPVTAAPDAPFVFTWVSIDGGGGRHTGGPYELYMTVGQPDAWTMECGKYPLGGGFWPRLVNETLCLMHIPVVRR